MGLFRSVKECEQISADYGGFFGARIKELCCLFADKNTRAKISKDLLKFLLVISFALICFGLFCFSTPWIFKQLGMAGSFIGICVLFAIYKFMLRKQAQKRQNKEQE